MDGGLSGLDEGFQKRVRRLVEEERETDMQSCDAQVVLNHSHLNDVLARAGIAHRLQRIDYLLWIESHKS